MAAKDQVLAVLTAAQGQFVSGQELARQLGVSRAAVWKAIQALRAEGCPIHAATNRGYALSGEADLLTEAAIRAALSPDLPLTIRVEDCLPGTNAVLRRMAEQGAPEGTVLVARSQSEGRGRSGRSFFSPEGSGLYLSILLRPRITAAQSPLLTAMAAVAAARAAERVSGQEIRIKWVNDLWRKGRKVCGILTEAALDLESGGLQYVVLGPGFNLTEPEGGWPASLREIAGPLFDTTPPPGTRARLAAEFLQQFFALYKAFAPADFLPEYRRRQLLLGQPVELLMPGRPSQTAWALDIDREARLVVRLADGQITALAAGEVRARPCNDTNNQENEVEMP